MVQSKVGGIKWKWPFCPEVIKFAVCHWRWACFSHREQGDCGVVSNLSYCFAQRRDKGRKHWLRMLQQLVKLHRWLILLHVHLARSDSSPFPFLRSFLSHLYLDAGQVAAKQRWLILQVHLASLPSIWFISFDITARFPLSHPVPLIGAAGQVTCRQWLILQVHFSSRPSIWFIACSFSLSQSLSLPFLIFVSFEYVCGLCDQLCSWSTVESSACLGGSNCNVWFISVQFSIGKESIQSSTGNRLMPCSWPFHKILKVYLASTTSASRSQQSRMISITSKLTDPCLWKTKIWDKSKCPM